MHKLIPNEDDVKTHKKALVTGVSSGFGKQICELLLSKGYIVYGFARRNKILTEISNRYPNFHAVNIDITNTKVVEAWCLEQDIASIDLLVNNAGMALGADKFGVIEWADIESVINTNIIGLSFLTWLYCRSIDNKINRYIINISSIAGSYSYPNNNVYGATKAYVNHLSTNLRSDYFMNGLRVTNIEPGLARTEFSQVRFKGDSNRERELYQNTDYLTATDIASVIEYLISLPDHVNISRVEIMPKSQANGPLLINREDSNI